MRFALFPNEREPDLLSRFAEEASEPLQNIEAKAFCKLAESLGRTSIKMQSLRRMVGLEETELLFIVNFVKGPGQLEQPFALNTKYGYIIFVFQRQEDLYRSFVNLSTQALPKGCQLQTVLFVVHSIEEFIQEINKGMPSDKPYSVVFEGTKEFREIVEELLTSRDY